MNPAACSSKTCDSQEETQESNKATAGNLSCLTPANAQE